MNIFYLDHDPQKAAQYLIDRHVNKMILESAQMLANCYSDEQRAAEDCPKTQSGNPRKLSYFNHPCSKWVRESKTNFHWLADHALYMYKEKVHRTGRGHFSFDFIKWCINNEPDLPDVGHTEPARAFSGKEIKNDDIVEDYRTFYVLDKIFDKNNKRMDIWTKGARPDWWVEKIIDNYTISEIETYGLLS